MDDLGLQRLEAVADAAQAVRKAASVMGYYAGHSDYTVEMSVPARAWEALADALNVLDKRREMPEMEYEEHQDSPWYTGAFNPHINGGPWVSTESDSCVDVAGHWHFPGPDVKDKVKPPIRIVPLKQGFVVEDTLGRAQYGLAFTDAFDAAEWLLEWLGFEDEIVESVHDILAGLWDADELYSILPDCVAGVDYDELTEDELGRAWYSAEYKRALDVAGAVLAYIKSDEFVRFSYSAPKKQLLEAVKKWRGIEGG